MRTRIYALILLACAACSSPEPTVEKPGMHGVAADQLQQTLATDSAKDQEKLGNELLETESLGGLKIGMPMKATGIDFAHDWGIKPGIVYAADGQYHRTYWHRVTIDEIEFSSDDSTFQNPVVNSVTAHADLSGFRTGKNIGIGNSYDQVMQAYAKYIDKEGCNDSLITAGSIYGGLIFNFEKKKVSLIFLGAAAE